jgi:hypothetical protein
MGLDTSHDCWHGAYSSFHRFRVAVAKAAGIPLDFMEGFYDAFGSTREDALPEYLRGELPVRWSILKHDPVHTLLDHSDCDGDIPWRKCLPLAKRLEELAPEVEADSREDVLAFAIGLRVAAERHEPVDFH